MDSLPSTLELEKQNPAAETDSKVTQDKGNIQQLTDQNSIPDPYKDAEFWPLSGKPFFHVVLKQYHLAKRFWLTIPSKVSKILPHGMVRAKIICKGKVWDMGEIGNQKTLVRFESQKWGDFASDNNLAVGDVCLFELIEGSYNSTSVQFKVQILKESFPPELLENVPGFTMDNPISLE